VGPNRNTNDFCLTWSGPWKRTNATERFPTNPEVDTYRVRNLNCDAVIFMVFNRYTSTGSVSEGLKHSGLAKGGFCEAAQSSGYAVVVDQGESR
jgi:hypothetical protein